MLLARLPLTPYRVDEPSLCLVGVKQSTCPIAHLISAIPFEKGVLSCPLHLKDDTRSEEPGPTAIWVCLGSRPALETSNIYARAGCGVSGEA